MKPEELIERLEKACDIVAGLHSGRVKKQMTIPVDKNRDTDVIACGAIRDAINYIRLLSQPSSKPEEMIRKYLGNVTPNLMADALRLVDAVRRECSPPSEGPTHKCHYEPDVDGCVFCGMRPKRAEPKKPEGKEDGK